MSVALSDEERRSFIERTLAELEQEHERRENRAQRRSTTRRSDQLIREEELSALRNDLRRRFYEENGYAQSVDRSGRSIWLSPAEQELRESGRKKRRKKRRVQLTAPRTNFKPRDVVLFILMCLGAVGLGLALVS